MSYSTDKYIKMYERYCLFDDSEFSHEELVQILIGSLTNNTQDLEKEISYIEMVDNICMKLVGIPKHTHHIRTVMSNLESVNELLVSNRIGICETLMILFTTQQIKECIF